MDRIIVAYFSLFQNTKRLADEIAAQTGGTLIEIESVHRYAFDYNTAAKEVRSQISRNFCPQLLPSAIAMEDFDYIFIGSPNWFKTMAPPVRSFLRQYDFTGKVIVPFCTHGGGGFGNIAADMASECPGAILWEGLATGGADDSGAVRAWLARLAKTRDRLNR